MADEQSKINPKQEYGITDSKNMQVKVYSPFKVYYNDLAESISAENDTGSFDILPKHHNFMTLLNSGEVVVKNNNKDFRFNIDKGIMHVKADEVIVFLDV